MTPNLGVRETGCRPDHKIASQWRDTFFNFNKTINNYVHTHGVKVKDVMTLNPVAVTEDASLDAVVQLMQTHNVKRLPVVRGGEVIGIISRANLMRALVSIHREAHEASKDDAKIRERILDDIAEHSWAQDVVVDVVVHNGVADLWGTVSTAEQVRALRVLVESTPGGKRVEPYLTCDGELLSLK
jgi:predicted transcriptional regulator